MRIRTLLLAGLMLAAPPLWGKTVNLEYILDASGSMTELMKGEMKIDIAKKTLVDLIGRLPAGGTEITLNVGLRIYGHTPGAEADPARRCEDSVLEMPVKGVDLEKIKEIASAVTARGYTPIAYSLQQAKNDFPEGKENDNVIILISDGKETCGGDPCAVAKELHEAGIAVTIHVVGFDIKPEEKAQLECIAEASGGKYFPAESAQGLSEALGKAQEQVLKKESESVRIKVSGPGKVRFDLAQWVPGAPYRYRFESLTDGKAVAEGGGTLTDVMVPPGTYRLVWDQTEHGTSDAVLLPSVEVQPGQTATIRLDTGIHLVPAKWLKEAPYEWLLKDPATGETAIRVSWGWGPVLVPAGTYELWYRQWEHGTSQFCLSKKVEVKPGSATEFDLNTGIGFAPLDPKLPPPYQWVLYSKETGEEAARVSDSWGPIPVPPGKYSLSIRQTQHGHSLTELVPEFTIEAGQLAELEM